MVKKDSYVPERGDIAWINFALSLEREQAGRRPALVLSSKQYNNLVGLCIVCPITSKRKGYNFEVPVRVGETNSVILSDHIRSIDWRNRRADLISRIEPQILAEVLENVRVLLSA